MDMVIWMLCGYLAMAAAFYLIVIATAASTPLPALLRHAKWQRPRKIKSAALFRRLRMR